MRIQPLSFAFLPAALSLAFVMPGALAATQCSAKADPGGCPFMGPRGNVALFSRCAGPKGLFTREPTPVGNAV